MKTKLLWLLVAFGTVNLINPAIAKSNFDASQLSSFENTNQCLSCDLSSAELSLNHSGAILDNSNLSNIIGYSGPLQGINFSNASLKNVNLTGAYIPNSNFSNADLTNAHFNGAMLREANFYGAKGADLTGAADICFAILPDGKRVDC